MVRQQVVLERLREKLMLGEYKGGEKLQEVALAKHFGVSRTPLRQALIILAEEGLLVYRPNRGYVVREFTIKDVLNAYTVRESLESLACRQAAELGLSEEIKNKIEDCLKAGDKLFSVRRLQFSMQEDWREINFRFHELIFEASQNETLTSCIKTAASIPFTSSRVVHWFEDEDRVGLLKLREVNAQHWSIFKAISARNAHEAETAMRWHVSYAVDHIRDKFTSGELIELPEGLHSGATFG